MAYIIIPPSVAMEGFSPPHPRFLAVIVNALVTTLTHSLTQILYGFFRISS